MSIALIERARDNIRAQRNTKGEDSPQNQVEADLRFRQMRRECEKLLTVHGETKQPYPRWEIFHPWILMAALLETVKPVEILERTKLSITVDEIEPPVAVTLSHAGRNASRSWFISLSVQGVPEMLKIYKEKGEISLPDGTGHPLRRANLDDAENYQPLVGLFTERFNHTLQQQ